MMIDWDLRIKKRVDYLSCIEGKGGLKDIHCIAQNYVLFFLSIINYLLILLRIKNKV